ncbi:MAG: tRNA 2-thiouridine(34) synthase MnmA, partial [Elusimicrobia bacterium]|nr:tRNA 2-thiouridine(34) synthase MnmA [Elusimicrobiota bacterium]
MKVLAMMSGGVDSSVTAHLLKKEGHEVVGLTLRLFEVSKEGGNCCGSPRDIYDAKECARLIGIPHYSLDESGEFKQQVIESFKRSYLMGETPNPCVECNRSMKFGHILELAKTWGFDAVATGHYAKIKKMLDAGCWMLDEKKARLGLYKAKDKQKDQSYFLYMLKESQLKNILFPLGDLEKTEVRKIADGIGLPTAQKPDSQEICFVGALAGGDYRKLLGDQNGHGPIIQKSSGRVLAQHEGYYRYTVGQREGLGVAVGRPLYVTEINPASRTVYVDFEEELYKKEIAVGEIYWVNNEDSGEAQIRAQVKIRYKSPGVMATIYPKGFGAGEPPLNPVAEAVRRARGTWGAGGAAPRGPASTRGEPSGLVLGSGGKG